MKAVLAIAGRPIGPEHPPYVIAEMSGNHNGDINRAFAIIEAAKAAGADAVKLQTYTADTMTIDHDGPGFTVDMPLWQGRRLHDLYREAHTPWEWHAPLFAKGRELGITVFSSPFDASAVDFLKSLDTPAYKVASFEIVDIPLIEKIAATGKPMIVSTGMANEEEIADAVDAATSAGCKELILLHCVSAYPAPADDANLAAIPELARRFGRISGLSDHSLGSAVAAAATAFGACVIEKHVTLNRADGGVDSAFSLEPDELRELVEAVHMVHAARGKPAFGPKRSESAGLAYRRSLYVVADVAANALLTPQNIRAIRPGAGLPPKFMKQVLGCRATRALKRGEPLAWDMVAD